MGVIIQFLLSPVGVGRDGEQSDRTAACDMGVLGLKIREVNATWTNLSQADQVKRLKSRAGLP